MADVKTAVLFVLKLEDSTLSGKVTTLPGDSGGATRFGLASRWHPQLVQRGYYSASKVDNETALAIAVDTYTAGYAQPCRLADIDDQTVANDVLSFAINAGPEQAVLLLQRAVSSLGHLVAEDGSMGPNTLEAVNAADPAKLLGMYTELMADFYRDLCKTKPEMAGLLDGLLNRAHAGAVSEA